MPRHRQWKPCCSAGGTANDVGGEGSHLVQERLEVTDVFVKPRVAAVLRGFHLHRVSVLQLGPSPGVLGDERAKPKNLDRHLRPLREIVFKPAEEKVAEILPQGALRVRTGQATGTRQFCVLEALEHAVRGED